MQQRYLRNEIGKMAIGISIAQLVGMLSLPILTTLYSPLEIGVYSVFISVASLLAIITSGRLEVAIPLPRGQYVARNLAGLCLSLSFLMCGLTFILLRIFEPYVRQSFLISLEGYSLSFIPATAFCMSLFNILSMCSLREKKFSLLSLSSAFQPIANLMFACFWGLFIYQSYGLMLARLLSLLGCNLILRKVANVSFTFARHKSANKRIASLLKRFKRFPLYNLPNSLLTLASRDSLLFLAAFMNSFETAGFFVLARSILFAPAMFLSSVLGPIMYQEFIDNFRRQGKNVNAVKIIKAKFYIGLPSFLLLSVIAKDLFEFFFPSEWVGALDYFYLLLPCSFVYLFTSWMDRIFQATDTQHIPLLIQLSFDILTGFSIFAMFLSGFGFYEIVVLYSLVIFVHQSVYFYVAYIKITDIKLSFTSMRAGDIISKLSSFLKLTL